MSVRIFLVPDGDLNSNQPTDAEIVATGGAVTGMITEIFGPAWGEDWQGHYQVIGLKRSQSVPKPDWRTWLCHLKTSIPVPGAGGYHTRDVSGAPVMSIDVVGAAMHSQPLSLVISHEIEEALGNPFVDRGILASYGAGQGFYYQELADPCEGQPGFWFPYQGQQFAMANFTLPSYWTTGAPGPYDHGKVCTAPLHPAGGGVQTVFVVSGATQIAGDGLTVASDPDDPRIHAGNRR